VTSILQGMVEAEASIIEFRITLRNSKRLQPYLSGVHQSLKDNIYQSADLANVFYASSAVYSKLETKWTAEERTLSVVKSISTESVAVLHCSTYVKRFDYIKEEPNIKSIILSKGYDIGVCTGRSFVKYFCSDLIYADRFFSYRFGDRKYWFICYLSSVDDAELIRDRLVELFSPQRGLQVFAWLGEKLFLQKVART
jgi:hypothetical protein